MKRKTVSLCLIARDEEATIGAAIKSVLALVDEVIVVDTGSRDNTRIIAEGYGARVLEVPWNDDFAAARNAGLDEALCDWILVLDADECLQPSRPVEFQRYLHDPQVAGYRVRIVSPREEPSPDGRHQVRLFRNSPEARYSFPVHEQITPALEGWAQSRDLVIRDSTLVVVHDGESPERRTRRRERNLRLLNRALGSHGQEPYFPYRLACETMLRLDEEVLPVGGLDEALGHLQRSWRLLSATDDDELKQLHWLPDLGTRIASGMLAMGEVAAARATIGTLRQLFPDHPLVLLHGVAADVRHLAERITELAPAAAAQMVEAARGDLALLRSGRPVPLQDTIDGRVCDLYPLRYLGELALLEGRVTEASERFEQALEWDPNYSFAWLGLSECSRFAGDRKRAMKLYLRAVTESEWNHRAWFRGADLMADMGFHDNAASWLRTACTRFPEHPRARRERLAALDRNEAPATV